jgi:hypothetical protein
MGAAARLLSQGSCPRSRGLPQEGAKTVLAAAALLEAVLEAAGQPAARAFAEADGLGALRLCLACGQLGDKPALEVHFVPSDSEEIPAHGIPNVMFCSKQCLKIRREMAIDGTACRSTVKSLVSLVCGNVRLMVVLISVLLMNIGSSSIHADLAGTPVRLLWSLICAADMWTRPIPLRICFPPIFIFSLTMEW